MMVKSQIKAIYPSIANLDLTITPEFINRLWPVYIAVIFFFPLFYTKVLKSMENAVSLCEARLPISECTFASERSSRTCSSEHGQEAWPFSLYIQNTQFSLCGASSESIDKSPALKLLDGSPICYPYFKKSALYTENWLTATCHKALPRDISSWSFVKL